MASHIEIALFFRLALRVELTTTLDVERWIDLVLASDPVINYPIAELAAASRLQRATVDELLGEFTGSVREFLPGHMVMALLARRLSAGAITLARATLIGRAVAAQGNLSAQEYLDIDRLDDELQLAASGTYGDVGVVGHEVQVHFERYSAYAIELPATM